jgi:formate/nitrite transporter FocA (FNT family)
MLVALQQVNIVQKMKQAPDGDYQIGVLIGSFIPFVIFVGLAYWMYIRAKKRDQNP